LGTSLVISTRGGHISIPLILPNYIPMEASEAVQFFTLIT